MGTDPNFTPEQLETLKQGRDRASYILRAARVASFNGWTLAALAGLTVLTGLTSPVLLILGAGMAVVARNELRGRDLLRALDPRGPRLLTRNQLGLMALVVVYCGWSLLRTYTHPDPQWATLQELAGLEPDFIADLVVVAYSAAIVVTVLVVGLNARFYARRAAALRDYLADTPGWVVDILRSTAERLPPTAPSPRPPPTPAP